MKRKLSDTTRGEHTWHEGMTATPAKGAAAADLAVKADRRRRIIKVVLLFVAVIVNLALLAWLVQTFFLGRDLLAAQRSATTMQTALEDFDGATAAAELEHVQEFSGRARWLATVGVFDASTKLPIIGGDLRNVQLATVALDDTAQQVLPAVVDTVETLNPEALVPADGTMDMAPLQAAAPELRRASDAMSAINATVAAEVTPARVTAVQPTLDEFTQMTARLDASVMAAADTTALAPALLGADGPRDILVLFQNNAELRTRGGIPGAAAVIRVDSGTMELKQQLSTGSFDNPAPAPVLPIDDLEPIHSDRVGRYIQNVNLTADFPTTGALAVAMWQRSKPPANLDVSAVISLDPVALSYLLEATGPVTLPGSSRVTQNQGTTANQITADNAVEALLNKPYTINQTPQQMDAYFALVAASTFDAVATNAQGGNAVTAFRRGIAEGRILMWSPDQAEQQLLVRHRISGRMDADGLATNDVGVFLNQATASKLGYYLDQEITVLPKCGGTATAGAFLTLTLTSQAPADVATLPSYLSGNGRQGVPRGTDRQLVLLYSHADKPVQAVTVNGAPVGISSHSVRGLSVALLAVDIPPAESVTIDAYIAGIDTSQTHLQHTPMARDTALTIHRSCVHSDA